jgi:hypothetical protein
MIMPQVRVQPEIWEIDRGSIELIPLIVRDINNAPTEAYTVACVPVGTQPTVFSAPDAAGAVKGYLVNGPTLWLLGNHFLIKAKITGSPETPVRTAANLYLR